jgi:hypothetical protein
VALATDHNISREHDEHASKIAFAPSMISDGKQSVGGLEVFGSF